MKSCNTCGVAKELSEFPKNPTVNDGRGGSCLVCRRDYQKQWKANNPEKVKANYESAKCRDWSSIVNIHTTKRCKSCNEEKSIDCFHRSSGGKFGVRSECKVCTSKKMSSQYAADISIKVRSAEWFKNNPLQARSIRKKSYYKHREKRLIYRKTWREENIDRDKAREKQYLINNRAIVYAKNARRRAAETLAVPKWLNYIQIAQVEEFYEIATARTMQMGIKHHVDHIVPLCGKGVNGLHVPWNLQVLTEKENCSKHNKYQGNQ